MAKGSILLTASLFAVPTTVLAQTASVGDPASPPTDNTVQEIVVTAQRREERLQDVPIAVTALTGGALARQGVAKTTDLTAVVPALVLERTVQVITPFLRGVGNASTPPGNDPSIAVYLDGVYQSSPTGLLFSFNNIERIEVLKGPQGTLFGRNATGGVINIVTVDPKPGLQAHANLGYSSYDTVTADAYAGGGNEKVTGDVSIFYTKQNDGWGRNLFTPAQAGTPLVNGVPTAVPAARIKTGINEELGIRSKLIVNFDELTRLELAGRYVTTKGDQGLYRHGLPGAVLSADGVTPFTFTGGFYDQNNDFPYFFRDRQWAGSAELTHDFDALTVKSITSYLDARNVAFVSSDSTPQVSNTNQRQPITVRTFTQELQLAAPTTSPIQWLLGGYYYRSKAGWTEGLHFVRGALEPTFDLFAQQRVRSLAAFGQTTFAVADDTKLTLGLRYTSDRYSANQYNIGTRISATPAAQFQNGVITGNVPTQRTTASKLTWRGSIDHRFSPEALAYASVSRGYKAGGFNLGGLCLQSPATVGNCTSIAGPVKSEVLDDYEVGLKTDLLDRRLRLNFSAFYYDYKNLQVQAIVGLPPVSVLDNAAAARVFGGELEGTATPGGGFTITFGSSLLNAKYRSFPAAVVFVPRAVAPYNDLQTVANVSGNRLNRSPKFTGNLGIAWRRDIGVGELELSGNVYHNSGFFWEPNNRLKQGAYNLANGQIGFTLPDGHWHAQVWARNLFDKRYYSFLQASSSGDQGTPAAPRTVGITLGWTG